MESVVPYYFMALSMSIEQFAAHCPGSLLLKRPGSVERIVSEESSHRSHPPLHAFSDWNPTSTGDTREIPEFIVEWRVAAIAKTSQFPPFNRVVLGRSRVCDLFVPSPSISKRHALFFIERGRATHLADNHSMNGTFHHGRKLVPGEPVPLSPGDPIRFGRLDFDLLDGAAFYRLLCEAM